MILTISLITILYFIFYRDHLTIENILSFTPKKENGLFLSTVLYGGYNILCCSGVLVPLSTSVKKKKVMTLGMQLGKDKLIQQNYHKCKNMVDFI